MQQPVPGEILLDGIKYQIETGILKIPQFQRNFVWSIEDSAKLMDSVIQGYPVGSFIIWKTKEKLHTVKNIGNLSFPDVSTNDYIQYVLDGQQRITSIYASIKGCVITRENGVLEDYSKIYVDLCAQDDAAVVITDISGRDPLECISLSELMNAELIHLARKYGEREELLAKIDKYRKQLNGYRFPKIELEDTPLTVATDIFTRLNNSGKTLSVFEIMCAKMYDEDAGFDLYEKRQSQIEKWKTVNYETVPDMTVLQAVAICSQNACGRNDILHLPREDFIQIWDKVDKAFDNAIDYFKSMYGIPVSKLLPYDSLLVPFVYYFYKHPTKPSGKAKEYLMDYFWRTVIGTRFTEGVVSKLSQDSTDVIDVILSGGEPKYDRGIDLSLENLKANGYFTLGSAYIKGLICLLCSKHPKAFNDGAEVVIDNAWLSQGNSKNYHHFFPKAYMKRTHPEIDENLVNHIANITIVDGYLNKSLIKDKAPATYMAQFQAGYSNLQDALDTHLIYSADDYGIWGNDYELFFEQRLKAIQDELLDRVIYNPKIDRSLESAETSSQPTSEDSDSIGASFDINDVGTFGLLTAGALAYELIKHLFTEGKITSEEKESMFGNEFRRKFKRITYPVLAHAKTDNRVTSTRIRYYTKPIVVNGEEIFITSQWYDESRNDLINWYLSHFE